MATTVAAFTHTTLARTNTADIVDGQPQSATPVAAELNSLVAKVNTVGTGLDTLSDQLVVDLTLMDKALSSGDHTDQNDQTVTLNATTHVGRTHVLRHNASAPVVYTLPAVSSMSEGWSYRLFCLSELGAMVRIPIGDNGLAARQGSAFGDGSTYSYVPLNHGDSMEIFTGFGADGSSKYLYQVFRCDRYIYCRQEIDHTQTADFMNKVKYRVVLINMDGASADGSVTMPDLTLDANKVYHGDKIILVNLDNVYSVTVGRGGSTDVFTGVGPATHFPTSYSLLPDMNVSMIADVVNNRWVLESVTYL